MQSQKNFIKMDAVSCTWRDCC